MKYGKTHKWYRVALFNEDGSWTEITPAIVGDVEDDWEGHFTTARQANELKEAYKEYEPDADVEVIEETRRKVYM